MGTQKPRQIAVEILQRLGQQAAAPSRSVGPSSGSGRGPTRLEPLLEERLARADLSGPDRALTQELVFGAVRWQATLDWLIARKTAGRTQKPALQALLRLGLYQLFWLDRVPDHAAVHESVQLARELGFGPQSGFINAVLRGCLRERAVLEAELESLKSTTPPLGYSHPEWLCQRWEKRWGKEALKTLLVWNNTPAIVYARVNRLRATPESLAAQFEKEGVLFTPRTYPWAQDPVFALRSHPPLTSLASFQQGLFYVQDPSTLLAVRELDPQPGERVLDLCAAPGGKTVMAAQQMQDTGEIVAEDSDNDRLERVRQNAQRLGATCIRLAKVQERKSIASGLFDRVLVDAPCSNTGVMRRRVELRWRIQPAEVRRLSELQLALLQQAAQRVKPGGVLVYSTCSLEPEENGAVMKRFVEATPGAALESERELTPINDGVDGAYVARLRVGG